MVEKTFDEFGETEHFYNIFLENKRKKVDLSNKNPEKTHRSGFAVG